MSFLHAASHRCICIIFIIFAHLKEILPSFSIKSEQGIGGERERERERERGGKGGRERDRDRERERERDAGLELRIILSNFSFMFSNFQPRLSFLILFHYKLFLSAL
jgi:hypothetical protein